MSKLEDLILDKCPNGVVFKRLNDLGSFYGGLSGKTKEDFSNGNSKYITYMNVFSNISVNTKVQDKVKIDPKERQNQVKYGDVLFTGSSENPSECGISSVVTDLVSEELYLNSFCFGFRFFQSNLFNPEFLKYLFRSGSLRKQINKTASGVTRFNVSKKKMGSVLIPIPPLEVQQEVVRILDNFTELTAELTAELIARKQQYEHYLNKVYLDLVNANIGLVKFNEIGTIERGNGLQKSDFALTGYPCIHYGQIYTFYGTYTTKTKTFVPIELASKLKKVNHGDIVIAVTSENIEDVCKGVLWLGNEPVVTGGHTAIFRHNQNPKYLAYYLQTRMFFDQKRKIAHGTKVIEVTPRKLENILIPIPSLEEQARIVSILDRFDTLVNDIKQGLPAEIAARQKQYEYYRDKLLTFKEVGDESI